MSHKSEEQVEPVGVCPCGHELLLYNGKIQYHNCPYGVMLPFDLVKYTEDVLGVNRDILGVFDEKPQKTTAEWIYEYESGKRTVRDLYNAGFRPRSNKYRSAVKEWKYYKKYYSVTITLTQDDYNEFKCCEHDVWREEEEMAERAEYERFKYLENKYGEQHEN